MSIHNPAQSFTPASGVTMSAVPFPGEFAPHGHRLADGLREADPGLDWYLIRSATRRELTAEEGLVEAGFAVYLPVMTVKRRLGRRKVRINRALFPGYMFVGLGDGQGLYGVEAVEAVHAVVRFSRERDPQRLRFPLIQTILAQQLEGAFDRTRKDRRKDPERGEPIDIIAGQFKGFPAEFVLRRPDDRIELLLTMFGRKTKLVLDPEKVAGLDDCE